MRTDSQARHALRLEAIRSLLDIAGPDRLWDAVAALLDMGVTVDEIEEVFRSEDREPRAVRQLLG